MNEWQCLRQLQYRLQGAVWPTSANKIWGKNAVITPGPTEDALPWLQTPFALIMPGSLVHDPDEPRFVQDGGVTIRLAASVAGDAVGENVLMGANRVSEIASGNRGLLELQERLFNTVGLMVEQDGLVVKFRASGVVAAMKSDRIGYVAWRDYTFELVTTVDFFYEPPLSLLAVNGGGGNANLTWKLPPDRFDRYRVRLVRKAGGTPPVDLLDGSIIALSGNLATSKTDNPGAGTWSYSLFGSYDDRNPTPTADIQTSAPVSATVVVT